MNLTLQNGYPSPWPKDLPEPELDSFSEDAPGVQLTLKGVTHLQWLYTLTVEFENATAAKAAQVLTGWTYWEGSETTLEALTSSEEGYAHPAIVAAVPYGNLPNTAFCGYFLAREAPMKQYTVLLLRPDYIADDYGQDTYLAHVEAFDVLTAQETAQREAYQTDGFFDDGDDHDPGPSCADYLVLTVFEGHLNDMKEGA